MNVPRNRDLKEEIYTYIKECSEDGFPPSIREICDGLNISSTSTVHRYINMLVDEGVLDKNGGKNRSVRLSGSSSVKVPLMGTVTAGQPITAIQEITDYIAFNPDRRHSGQLFALKIRGESMINAGIFDADIVICEQMQTVRNGEIAVVLVDDEDATVKTFYKEDGHYRLQPENDSMDPIIVDYCQILGKVIAVLRYL